MQMMNVFCEGTLWQDMPSLHTVGREHCTADKNGVPRHEILAGGWLARITGQSLFSVNSYHHQAVKDPGRNLTVCGRSRDGTAEAFIHRTLPFFCGVQWHPEIEPDAVSRSLLEAFLKAADLSASRRG